MVFRDKTVGFIESFITIGTAITPFAIVKKKLFASQWWCFNDLGAIVVDIHCELLAVWTGYDAALEFKVNMNFMMMSIIFYVFDNCVFKSK
jgi:hypothetical protein